MDCFVACAPLRKRFAFVAGNDGYAFADGRSATRADNARIGSNRVVKFHGAGRGGFFCFDDVSREVDRGKRNCRGLPQGCIGGADTSGSRSGRIAASKPARMTS